jgi:hypothetical protein
LYEVS